MTEALFAWPATAAFGRRVPKEKLYDQGSVTAPVREQFVSEVASVEWAYKLASKTVNLPGSDDVPEVQIFRISAKGDDVADSVLAAIDRAVTLPLIFEVRRADSTTRMTAAIQKSGNFHSTGWIPESRDRQPLPTAITLAGLYKAVLESLVPIAARPGESTEDIAIRLGTIAKLQREIAATERRLRNERQLNRKLEIRRALTALRIDIEAQR